MNKKGIPDPHLDFIGPKINYLKCPIEGHGQMDLKFVVQSELPHIQTIYCSLCVEERLANQKNQRYEIIPLDQIVEEIVLLSGKYTSHLEPLIDDVQKKYREIAEKDFRDMFEELTLRSDDFKKTLETFQNHISILCSNFEQLFQKRLETLFYESLITIDARLSSFKKTFEILRFKLKSYSNELASYLRTDQDLPHYCQNINLILKDLDALKNSRMPEQITRIVEGVSVTSPIAERFEKGCNFDGELCRVIDGIVTLLNQKVKTMQFELNTAIMKLNQGHQASTTNQHSEPKNTNVKENVKMDAKNEQGQEEEDEIEISYSESKEEKKASLRKPLLEGDDFECRHNEMRREDRDEWKIEEVEQSKGSEYVEEKKVEIDNGSIEKSNKNKLKEEEKSKTPKISKNSNHAVSGKATKDYKQEESEGLKRFAASLVLKAERKAKGELVTSGEFSTNEEGKNKHDDFDEILLARELRKQRKNSLTVEHPRLSKKIMKPKRRSKQVEREGEPKFGKYTSPDMQKKHSGRVRWRDPEASDSDTSKSPDAEEGDNMTWDPPQNSIEKPFLFFDKGTNGT